MPLVYDELRALARSYLAGQSGPVTLQPTALVHEAYLRMTGGEDRRYGGRAHFMAVAAKAMRRSWWITRAGGRRGSAAGR